MRSLFVVFYIWSLFGSVYNCVQGNCLGDQRALLLQLNQSLSPRSFSVKRSTWHLNTDCCSSWDGVECDKAGHVISLDLSSDDIWSELNSSSSLFKLGYLVRLNLAHNYFTSEIPSGTGQLTNLEYLNLSYSGFGGQIPIEISRMTRLVTLDLSMTRSFSRTELIDPDLDTLTQNLTELRELLLDGISLSRENNKWCRVLSSSLHKLQVLSLSFCGDLGNFDSSLSKLRSLSVLHLDSSSISGEVPNFFGKFKNLASLHLSGCGLYGKFPEKVLQLESLQSVDLSGNHRLQGYLPEFPKGRLLRELVLSYTSFTGELPNSIGNLRFLSRLDLKNCRFNRLIPTSFSKLNQLKHLDLSNNSFTGSITSIKFSKKLIDIDLSLNRLTGPVHHEWKELPKLYCLNLANNLLNGTIPMSLFSLPSLSVLDLSMNQFTGQLGEFLNGSSSQLDRLDLSNNQLKGLIPVSIFGMSSLQVLILSSNNFSGTIHSNSITNLQTISLSGNQFTEIPFFLKDQPQLLDLDLSNNKIHGKIPNWIWKIGDGSLYNLNLSQNLLEDPDQPWPVNSFQSLNILDLHSNRLQGNNLILPSSLWILDYSFNNFTTMIPNISSHMHYIKIFRFSNNQLSGDISTWACNFPNVLLLDLSYNNFSGQIPSCLGSNSSITVLNLRGNNFQGNIPETLFPEFCDMKTLDLSNNKFEGRLPNSITNCIKLEVIDFGNNQLTDTFPSWLLSMPQLRVLVLKSNNFYGAWGNQCDSSMLQIIDISSNKFSGFLPKDCFPSWNAMIINKEEREWNHQDQILRNDDRRDGIYYQPKVTVTIKGNDIELVKIPIIFTSIDLSNNRFEGGIPEVIGSLTALYNLNFSHNAFTGKIPPTFGNLTHLESLDLSRNNLTGKIPFQLAGLLSISVLNLSFNKLVGAIPSGGQFQTFDSSSFQGNIGLCGFPLSKGCNTTVESPPNGSKSKDGNSSEDKFDWVLFVVTFLGFVIGAGMVIGPQYFWQKGRQWANKCINKILGIHY